MSLTILLADAHQMVRHGLRLLLETHPDFTVVGEAGDGREVLALVERIRPQVLLVELMLPGLHGLEVIRMLRQRFPATRVVVLSPQADTASIQEALHHGAAGYVHQDAGIHEVIKAVHEVVAAHRYVSPPLSEATLEAAHRPRQHPAHDPYDTLTRREREVLQLAAESHTNQAIAARLSIGLRTVETHRANLMRKLGLPNQTELIRFALRRGLLPLDDGS
jgi:DNA-binding NarL/FixJ family response regulator